MFLIMGILGVFIQGVVLKLFNDLCGERYVVTIAFLFGAIHNILYAIASNKAMIFVSVAVGSFVSMSFPTISAIKSNNVVSDYHGIHLQLAIASYTTCASSFL
jgi:fucose permease